MKLSALLALTAAPFALLAATPASAQDDTGHAGHAAAAPAAGPAMWKVADAIQHIYLFQHITRAAAGIEWYDATIACRSPALIRL